MSEKAGRFPQLCNLGAISILAFQSFLRLMETKADHVKDDSNNRVKHLRATKRQQNFLRLDVWISQRSLGSAQ